MLFIKKLSDNAIKIVPFLGNVNWPNIGDTIKNDCFTRVLSTNSIRFNYVFSIDIILGII